MKSLMLSRSALRRFGLVIPLLLAVVLPAPVPGQSPAAAKGPEAGQPTFESPDLALEALTAAVSSGDRPALTKLFGSAGGEIGSGDAVADKASFDRFAKRLHKRAHLVKQDDSRVVLYVGAENWPFPFPIASAGGRWYFDGEAGLREMFNRRIGENELKAIAICREYVRAQREYASQDRDGDEVLEYAQRMKSSPGARDGLYWEGEGENESPLGPFMAAASLAGYKVSGEPQPFHGYYFKILTRQGANAPGGAYGFVVNGNMIGGFALVAFPATWGNSGLMSFVVNQQGKVFQKDLGPRTSTAAAGLGAYDPDATWSPVEEP